MIAKEQFHSNFHIPHFNSHMGLDLCFELLMVRAEIPGGVWGGLYTPPQSRENSPRRANDSKLSGQFLQIRKKLPPNHLITKCNTVLFVGQYKGHALFVGHCSYIPPKSRTQVSTLLMVHLFDMLCLLMRYLGNVCHFSAVMRLI